MPVLVSDEVEAEALLQRRRGSGLDRYDEVWDGVYVMSPNPNNEHQLLITRLAFALGLVVDMKRLGFTLAGANVSNRDDDWTKNYRVPDVLVFLPGNPAENRDTHWYGGPDFAIEVTSPGDRTLDKLEFYADVGTSELLVIDRHPWRLTLYRRRDSQTMVPVAIASESQRVAVASEVLPVQFELLREESCIRVSEKQGVLYSIPIEC